MWILIYHSFLRSELRNWFIEIIETIRPGPFPRGSPLTKRSSALLLRAPLLPAAPRDTRVPARDRPPGFHISLLVPPGGAILLRVNSSPTNIKQNVTASYGFFPVLNSQIRFCWLHVSSWDTVPLWLQRHLRFPSVTSLSAAPFLCQLNLTISMAQELDTNLNPARRPVVVLTPDVARRVLALAFPWVAVPAAPGFPAPCVASSSVDQVTVLLRRPSHCLAARSGSLSFASSSSTPF